MILKRPKFTELQLEQLLITRLIDTGDIRTAVKLKLTADFFVQPDTREAYSFLLTHYRKHGDVPSLYIFKQEFEDFEFIKTTDSLAAIAERLRRSKLHRDLAKVFDEAVRLNTANSYDAFDYLKSNMPDLIMAHNVSGDDDLTKTVREALDEYDRVKNHTGLIGYEWPWQSLNDATLGLQPEELVCIFARPKAGKTWLLVKAAVHFHSRKKRVLFFTMEMPSKQIRRRVHAVWSEVDYKRLRNGSLSPKEEVGFRENLDAFSELQPFILSGNEDGDTGVLSIEAKIDEYEPDIVCVDGMYLMTDDRSNRHTGDVASMRHISQDLKRLAKRKGIAVICTTQANRSGARKSQEGMTDVAFSDSIAQDSDYLIRSFFGPREQEQQEILCTLPGVRESQSCTFLVNAFMAENLTEKARLEGDAEEAALASTDEGADEFMR